MTCQQPNLLGFAKCTPSNHCLSSFILASNVAPLPLFPVWYALIVSGRIETWVLPHPDSGLPKLFENHPPLPPIFSSPPSKPVTFSLSTPGNRNSFVFPPRPPASTRISTENP